MGPYDHRYKTGPYTRTWHRDEVRIEEKGHVTDLIAAEAVRWIEGRGDRPFFLYVPFTAVHIPVSEPQQWLDANPQIEDPGKLTAPIHVTDWMPTLCGLVGYRPSRDLKWDGGDVWPLLEGRKPAGPRTMYWVGPGARSSAVREGDWKLIVYRGGKTPDELFDLGRDPYEKENLASRLPDRVAQLRQVLARRAARDNDALVPKEE